MNGKVPGSIEEQILPFSRYTVHSFFKCNEHFWHYCLFILQVPLLPAFFFISLFTVQFSSMHLVCWSSYYGKLVLPICFVEDIHTFINLNLVYLSLLCTRGKLDGTVVHIPAMTMGAFSVEFACSASNHVGSPRCSGFLPDHWLFELRPGKRGRLWGCSAGQPALSLHPAFVSSTDCFQKHHSWQILAARRLARCSKPFISPLPWPPPCTAEAFAV